MLLSQTGNQRGGKSTLNTTSEKGEIACQQVLLADASVFSIQWLDLPPHLASGWSAAALYTRYLQHIRRFTLGIVQPRENAERVDFRLFGGPALLSFEGPREENNGLSLNICGGALVQPQMCNRGRLHFAVTPASGGARLTLELSDFCPLLLGGVRPAWWRRWLYRLTQAALHKAVTVRFLARLYREIAGRRSCVKVVEVNVQEGRRT